ncbi:membrane protein [Lasius niger]|uniref:Membrane protein n=1 Tax=Lasius niger TaxID=67767 RepID=A0A0J7KJM0_LASNI|nr:membrane protein [Lasius niger]
MRLELLWGETLMAQLWASCLDIPERDTFNLRGLFDMDQEEEEVDLTYAKEWISGHKDLWGPFPATLEELPQGNLDDYRLMKY